MIFIFTMKRKRHLCKKKDTTVVKYEIVKFYNGGLGVKV